MTLRWSYSQTTTSVTSFHGHGLAGPAGSGPALPQMPRASACSAVRVTRQRATTARNQGGIGRARLPSAVLSALAERQFQS
jgi:hypothetical protein